MNELPIQESHSCGCGHTHTDIPVLDARELAPAIRHGAILGAISQLKPGGSMNLIAPHNPVPLLDQVTAANGDAIAISYVSEDPWTVKFTRTA
ncbi:MULTISPECIES: DUF2249 domain-containing protein [Trueperella]|uniref:Uncharacterized protein (DUF2249 family) n=1 Tax=Trueperella abortisuis TaxID=445930 RepID=A0ABT9PFK4_9ACTO|nr:MULTISPECIES: DUF2249 domain-containing protein [Trueperella]MCI7305976.1 DUF2249 domain-containing protein [Trueperella sp.]MDP9831487.1 uncharacterized protein (DUF2249 family) [Trueperella abortisuis]MDY5404553.1 DUF2249 domain-containing protein [Trueperella sp.]